MKSARITATGLLAILLFAPSGREAHGQGVPGLGVMARARGVLAMPRAEEEPPPPPGMAAGRAAEKAAPISVFLMPSATGRDDAQPLTLFGGATVRAGAFSARHPLQLLAGYSRSGSEGYGTVLADVTYALLAQDRGARMSLTAGIAALRSFDVLSSGSLTVTGAGGLDAKAILTAGASAAYAALAMDGGEGEDGFRFTPALTVAPLPATSLEINYTFDNPVDGEDTLEGLLTQGLTRSESHPSATLRLSVKKHGIVTLAVVIAP